LRDLKEDGEDDVEAIGRVREIYERAVAQVPPGGEKRHWRRYIFLWLDYALFEEIETKVRIVSSAGAPLLNDINVLIGFRSYSTDISNGPQSSST
jgi:hypothetical protein